MLIALQKVNPRPQPGYMVWRALCEHKKPTPNNALYQWQQAECIEGGLHVEQCVFMLQATRVPMYTQALPCAAY